MAGHGPINITEFCELMADADRPWPAHSSRWKLPPAGNRKRGSADADRADSEDPGECRQSSPRSQ